MSIANSQTVPPSANTSSIKSIRVWLVMGTVSLAMIFIGHSAQSRYGLLLGFLCAAGLNSWVFFYGDIRLFSLFPGRELSGRDAWGVLRQVRELAIALEIRERPRVFLLASSTPFIFSAGIMPARTAIFLSSELIKSLSLDERRALLAFELLRFKNQQTAAATAASALAGFFALIATFLDAIVLLRFLPRKQKLRPGLRAGPFTAMFSPLVALLVRTSITRKQIILLDRETVQFLGEGETFSRAIWKLASFCKTKPITFSLAEAHLFVVNPLVRYRWWGFVSTHPPVERRIALARNQNLPPALTAPDKNSN